MVKLTPDLVQQSMQYLNPCRDRELCLRGYRIPLIENLGATLDQFDCIDFSDNDIKKLDGFPFLKRLGTLLFNHNAIVRISDNLEQFIPNLHTLVLTGNMIQDLCDLNPLSTLPNLKTLSLLHNPVTCKPHYRGYAIFKIKPLKLLDFKKVKLTERQNVDKFFKSEPGKEVRKMIAKKSRITLNETSLEPRIPSAQRADEMRRVKEAIARATSIEEVERLSFILQSGQIPPDFNVRYTNGGNGMVMNDMEYENGTV